MSERQRRWDALGRALPDLTDLFVLKGAPRFLRSDDCPEFVVMAVRDLIAVVGTKTANYVTQLGCFPQNHSTWYPDFFFYGFIVDDRSFDQFN